MPLPVRYVTRTSRSPLCSPNVLSPLCPPRVCASVCERTRAYTRVHAVAGTSAAFARGGGQGGRSDGKVNTDVAARKRRLSANANVARGAWRPRESRRHGADIVAPSCERRRGSRACASTGFRGSCAKTPVEFFAVARAFGEQSSGENSSMRFREQGGGLRRDQDGERRSRRMSRSRATPRRHAPESPSPFRLSRSRPMNYLCLPAFCATNSKNGMPGIADNLSCVSTVKSLAYATMREPRSSRAIYGCTDSRIVRPQLRDLRFDEIELCSTFTFISISRVVDKSRRYQISRKNRLCYIQAKRMRRKGNLDA